MKFSLILATINRHKEVEDFINSLVRQTFSNFELIIVDQNLDGRLNELIEKFKSKIDITHLYSEIGLSKARNIGLERITGSIVAFPDDDCIYPDDLLQSVSNCFERSTGFDGLLIQMKDSFRRESTLLERKQSGVVTRMDVFSTASISIFVNREAIRNAEKFDEALGLGSNSRFKGGEDYDFVLKAMSRGSLFYFESAIMVFHPILIPDIENKSSESRKRYFQRIEDSGASDYLLLTRYFSFPERLKLLITNFGGVIYYGVFGNSKQYLLHYYRCCGILRSIKYLKTL